MDHPTPPEPISGYFWLETLAAAPRITRLRKMAPIGTASSAQPAERLQASFALRVTHTHPSLLSTPATTAAAIVRKE